MRRTKSEAEAIKAIVAGSAERLRSGSTVEAERLRLSDSLLGFVCSTTGDGKPTARNMLNVITLLTEMLSQLVIELAQSLNAKLQNENETNNPTD